MDDSERFGFVKETAKGIAAAKKAAAKRVAVDKPDHGGAETKDQVVARLAKLSPIQYGQVKQSEAAALGCTVGELTAEVKAARLGSDARQGRALELPEPEPSREPVDGVALLDGIQAAVERYVVLPPHASTAIALWTVHSHAIEAAHHTPRLLFKSPEMRCGKSTALNVLRRLVVRPLQAANVSAAAIFRTVEAARPTLLVDEADTFVAKNEELRGVVNSGHEKHGAVIRVDGDDHDPRVFATFAATAIACIGSMPGTIEDRSIIINMKRRKRDEVVNRLRGDRAPELDHLASMAVRWVTDNITRLKGMDVDPPAVLSDRAADGWRPLLAIADLAGGDWPENARQAAIALSATTDDEESIRVMLLKDIRSIFDTRNQGKISSEAIVNDLHALEDRPWNEYGRARKPITKTKLANLLKPFGIGPGKVRIGETTINGYRFDQFRDSFERYLGCETSPNETGTRNKSQNSAENGLFQTGTSNANIPVHNSREPAASLSCSGVPVQNAPEAHRYTPDDEDLKVEREERLAIEDEPEAENNMTDFDRFK